MAKAGQKIEIGYRIVKIHTSKFLFEETSEEALNGLFGTPGALEISMNIKFNIDKEKAVIDLDVGTALIKKETKTALVEHVGRTSYLINNMDQVYDKGQDTYVLPNDILIQLYSIAYTHARALLATEISPTIYKDKYFLPVIDPSDLIKDKVK